MHDRSLILVADPQVALHGVRRLQELQLELLTRNKLAAQYYVIEISYVQEEGRDKSGFDTLHLTFELSHQRVCRSLKILDQPFVLKCFER